MAYYVNGKTYTDHPLMDEICYNCKLILKSIVIKNDILAMQKETENSLSNAELYCLMHDKSYVDFNTFSFSREILEAYGYDKFHVRRYLEDKFAIPESERNDLTNFANEYFKENFEEENDYYRMLMGLPPYNTGEEYYIWLTSSDIPSNYTKQVSLDIPLHEQPLELINLLYEYGTIDKLRETYVGSNYSYMLYLGNKSIDLYTARKAGKWDILYMPNVYYLIEDKFIDLYKINRDNYMNRSYQEFFSQSGEYYDQMMILIVLAETFANLITDTPQWYIRRDIFDIRSCKYFLESSGVEYFKIIPLKYQIRIVKNLNRLIKYKSSNQNASDILDIFGTLNTKIYKYWLYKKLDKDSDKGYSLEFISSEYTDSYDDYIKDNKFRRTYDDITLYDKYWDGEDTHSLVHDEIMNQEFTIQGTKYMSIEYQVSMREWLYQTEYLLGLILDSNLYNGMSDVRIAIPTIDDNATFRLADLFLLLVILTNSYYRDNLKSDETRIRTPKDINDYNLTGFDEDHYDWKKKKFPELFTNKNGRIHGFNSTLNKDELIKVLERRHSHIRFGMPDEDGEKGLTNDEYKARADEWLSELGVFDYVVPGSNIHTIEDMVSVYEIDTKVYETIRSAIINATNQDDKKYLEYIFQELFTRPFDTNLYTRVIEGKVVEYTDLITILQERDYILYDNFYKIMQESNIDTKQDMIRSLMNDVVDTLEYYVSGDKFNYLYSFVTIESFGAITKYIYLLLGFFKSYKVYFLDPYYTLESNDQLENSVAPIDVINEVELHNYRWDKSFASDYIGAIDSVRTATDLGESNMYEIADVYAYYDPDPLMDFDIDGVTAEKGEEPTTDVNGGEADPASITHYTMLNGGHSYLGMLNIRDANGGHATEVFTDYYHIDGGYAYDPDINKTDAMGSQMFNYMIDGGAAGRDEFYSNTVHLKLVGTELGAEAIISNREDNTLVVYEDGLYVGDQAFGRYDEFIALKRDMDNIINQVTSESGASISDLEVLADKDVRYNRIQSVLSPLTKDMEYVNKMMANDTFVSMMHTYVNNMTTAFKNLFSTEESVNPYAWEELD